MTYEKLAFRPATSDLPWSSPLVESARPPSRPPPSMSALESYQSTLIEHAMAVGALKFGTFTLKSGRSVPRLLSPPART